MSLVLLWLLSHSQVHVSIMWGCYVPAHSSKLFLSALPFLFYIRLSLTSSSLWLSSSLSLSVFDSLSIDIWKIFAWETALRPERLSSCIQSISIDCFQPDRCRQNIMFHYMLKICNELCTFFGKWNWPLIWSSQDIFYVKTKHRTFSVKLHNNIILYHIILYCIISYSTAKKAISLQSQFATIFAATAASKSKYGQTGRSLGGRDEEHASSNSNMMC